jgi:hypothetical protein
MPYTWLDALKDFLGAIGPAFIAVPWFYDFSLRTKKHNVSTVPVSGSLNKLKSRFVDTIREKIDTPRITDVIWTLVGLACVFASFLIGFISGIVSLLK